VSYANYYATSRELIVTLMSQGQHPVYIEHLSRMGSDAVTHAAAVAHLGLLLGIKLEQYLISQRKRLAPRHAKEVVNIGVAGMLHDMGKLSLPDELQRYNGVNPPERAEDLERWEEHARQGFELIRGGAEPSAAAAVLHHHQHFDGSGFPATVHRDGTQTCPGSTNVHVFARIIAVADLYDRLATPLDSSARVPNLKVLHLMRTRYASWCDPVVLRMLETIAPPFPPGSVLSLSDGTAGVVMDINPADPYRPVVKRIVGNDWKLAEEKTSLSAPGSPFVTHVGRLSVSELLPVAA
jgi:HD-GYP domain-containing protein (c-di-GMP phosphodiesterase class II)